MRTVLVEQDPEDRATIKELLTGLGYPVETYKGPEFCQAYRDSKASCPLNSPCHDIIILNNLFDNKTSGLEFLDRQRKCDCLISPDSCAVIAAGWPPSEVEAVERLGVRAFTKPYLVKDLVEWIYRLKKLVRIPS